MLTIVINSQKGGSGKTTLCAHLSIEAERAADGPVYLIDTDPQGTLSAWHEARTAERPHRVEIPLSQLAPDDESGNRVAESPGLDRVARLGARFCFIDTVPSRGDENAKLLGHADLVLVPVRPSPADLWAVAATVALLKQQRTPFLFVVNQATLNANITAQAIASLSHHGPVAETIIGVFRQGEDQAGWLVVGQEGQWAVATCATGDVSPPVASLSDALSLVCPIDAASELEV